ncbi:hypothetical protein ACP70R_048045 [Stipagrostis hirtigluma subsp. patula]
MAAPAMVSIGPFGGTQGTLQQINQEMKKLESITVYSTRNSSGGQICAIEFSYLNSQGSSEMVGPWGSISPTHQKNQVNISSGQYVVEVYGTVERNVKSLTMITNTGDVYGPFGDPAAGKEFHVPVKEGSIVGFFAHSGSVINAVGIYALPN